jgi:hypothetical protein
VRADPICPACSKPIRSGTLRHYDRAEFYHVYCRSRQLQLEALEQVNRPEATHAGAARLIEGTTRRSESAPQADRPPEAGSCPVCRQPATVVDSRPSASWLVVEGCPCGGFFVAAEILEWRLPRLTTAGRMELSATIQGFRAMGREAWLMTADEGISGRLVIRIERPDRPTQS